MPVQSYRQLIVWQKAMDFVAEIYRVTRTFPKEEMYGVTSQLRRAAVSIPINSAARRFLFRATLQKVKDGRPPESSANFWDMLADPCWKRKRRSCYPSD